MVACTHSDVLYFLHENGCMSVYTKRRSSSSQGVVSALSTSDSLFNTFAESKLFVYELVAQSDHVRMSKGAQMYGFALSPTSQKHVCTLMSDGRLFKYELYEKKSHNNNKAARVSPSPMPGMFLFDHELDAPASPTSTSQRLLLTGLSNTVVPQSPIFKSMNFV